MKTRSWTWILLIALDCGGPATESTNRTASAGDAVATYSAAGSIHGLGIADLEQAFPEARTPACIAARRARGGGSIEELMPCYREVTETLALERLVLAEVEDVERAFTELAGYPELRRHAYLEVLTRRLIDEIEISDEAIENHYAANRERYRRPGSLGLWNIFRRHEDPSSSEQTLEFLRDLKHRYEAGETFASLARAHSQSETRLRDGQVGHQVAEGQLPERLEKAAFALGDGDVSDPIAVRGGAVLLHVRNVVRGVDLTLQDVEGRIRQELRAQELAGRLEERSAALQPPAGAVVLDPGALIAALDGDDPKAALLDIDGDGLTVAELRQVAGMREGERVVKLEDGARERVLTIYDQRKSRALLALDLQAHGDAELHEDVEEHLGTQAAAMLVDEALRGEMETSAKIDAAELESYYRDNLLHYQSPLRFRLHLWDVPFGADPPGQLRRMEELREALASREIELADAVEEMGGAITDLGLRELVDLAEITNKARQYLLQTDSGDFSIPYQDDDSLHMLWVEEREEPRPLSYEEAAERVRSDYLTRFEEQLFSQMAEEKLARAEFLFDSEAVRRALVPE